MKVTVCELRNDPEDLERDWENLAAHVRAEESRLVVLPEMPFYPWVAGTRNMETEKWSDAVSVHNEWMHRFTEISPAVVAGTRPVAVGSKRMNEAFIWDRENGYRTIHTKYYLPDESGFWEASWYERGTFEFSPCAFEEAKAGFLICTELWFMEHARAYGKQGIHLLLSPRATPQSSTDKWVAGGRAAAVISGAFCLSSNRGGIAADGSRWAGTGWIIEPEEGSVLGLTSPEAPFLTVDIDLAAAENAKRTYPRYVRE